jgi:hypothetical protein
MFLHEDVPVVILDGSGSEMLLEMLPTLRFLLSAEMSKILVLGCVHGTMWIVLVFEG